MNKDFTRQFMFGLHFNSYIFKELKSQVMLCPIKDICLTHLKLNQFCLV